MGEASAATVREIEDTRERLDAEIRALEERMPEPARLAKRAAGIALGGGAAGAALLFMLKRRKRKRLERHPEKALKNAQVATVIRVFPDDFGSGMSKKLGKSMEDGEWKGWVALAGGTWVALRLLEVRQLKKMNRTLVGGRAA